MAFLDRTAARCAFPALTGSLAGLLATLWPPGAGASDSKESKIQQGFDAAPVPLNLDGKDFG